MAAARFYSSTSGSINLSAGIGSGDTSITVSTTTGLPGTTPFTLVVDPGTATEEIVNVTNVSGTTLTITRGVDGSSAQAHSAGVGNVRHMATARDFREPQEHIGASVAVHGVAGSVVGTTDVQTLTNKTAQAASAAAKGLIVKGFASQTAPYFEVQDSAGGLVVKVAPEVGGTVQLGGGTVSMSESGMASLIGFVSRFTASAASVVAGIFKASASQTADIVQVQNSAGTVLAKFDKDAKLTAPQVISTGPVSGTTGTFTGQAQSNSLNVVTLSEAQTLTGKSISGATNTLTAIAQASVTNLTTDLTALGGRVGVLEAGLPDNVKVGTGALVFNGSGEVVLTHSLGVVPTFISAQAQVTSATSPILILPKFGTATSTTVTLCAYSVAAGVAYVGTVSTVGWLVSA